MIRRPMIPVTSRASIIRDGELNKLAEWRAWGRVWRMCFEIFSIRPAYCKLVKSRGIARNYWLSRRRQPGHT